MEPDMTPQQIQDYFAAAQRAFERDKHSIAGMGRTDDDQDWSTENRWDHERASRPLERRT